VEQLDGPRAVVAVAGALDFDTAPALRDTLVEVIDQGHPRVFLETSGLRFCDSAGMTVLIKAVRHAQQHEGSLALVAAGENLSRLLALTGVDTVIAQHPTLSDALAETPSAS